MSVLAEAVSVIVPRAVIDRAYPGGLDAFLRDCPNRTVCTDGLLVRAGFLKHEDAEYFAGLLAAEGLRVRERDVFVDVAIVDQNTGPLAVCLWLEFARERDGTPVCWHAAARRGALHVPEGWEREVSLTQARFIGRPFVEQLRFLRAEARLDWFHDRASGRVFAAPPMFPVH